MQKRIQNPVKRLRLILFTKILSNFQPLSTFKRSAILDIRQGSEYTSEIRPFCLYCLRSTGSIYETDKVLSVIRQKGKPQNGCCKKTKDVQFSVKRTFFTPCFYVKFDVLCFLETPVLRFVFLLITDNFYQRFEWTPKFGKVGLLLNYIKRFRPYFR